MLWGLTIDPAQPLKYRVQHDVFVSFAVLDCREGGFAKQLLHLSVQDHGSSSQRLLCSFIVGYIFHQNLNLRLSAGEEVTFAIDGPNKVHLNGYTCQPLTATHNVSKTPNGPTQAMALKGSTSRGSSFLPPSERPKDSEKEEDGQNDSKDSSDGNETSKEQSEDNGKDASKEDPENSGSEENGEGDMDGAEDGTEDRVDAGESEPEDEADNELLEATDNLEQALTTPTQDVPDVEGSDGSDGEEELDYEEEAEHVVSGPSSAAPVSKEGDGREEIAAETTESPDREITPKGGEDEEQDSCTEASNHEDESLEAEVIPEIIILSSGGDSEDSWEIKKKQKRAKKRKKGGRTSRKAARRAMERAKNRHRRWEDSDDSSSEPEVQILTTVLRPPPADPSSDEDQSDETTDPGSDEAPPGVLETDRSMKIKLPFPKDDEMTTTTAVTRTSEERTSVLKISLPHICRKTRDKSSDMVGGGTAAEEYIGHAQRMPRPSQGDAPTSNDELCLRHLTDDPLVKPSQEQAARCVLCRVGQMNDERRDNVRLAMCPRHRVINSNPMAAVTPEQAFQCILCKPRRPRKRAEPFHTSSNSSSVSCPRVRLRPIPAYNLGTRSQQWKDRTRREKQPSGHASHNRGDGSSRPSRGYQNYSPRDMGYQSGRPKLGLRAVGPRSRDMARYVKSKYTSKVFKFRKREVNETTTTERRKSYRCRHCHSLFFSRVARRIHEEVHTMHKSI